MKVTPGRCHGVTKLGGILLLATVWLSAGWTQTTGAPVRLAIITEAADFARAADLLTVELSSQPQVQVLERAQMEKIYREQQLSAANHDYVKLGRMLGADGLLLMSKAADGTNDYVGVRLVAVKPGVMLWSERFGWPMQNPAVWASDFVPHLQLFWPKLRVLPQDAVPLSVVNLRSTIQSAEARELERQLTLLATERLSREPQLFITERQRMHSLAAEKEWNDFDESEFWDGSFLLDGTLDNAGYSPDTITISARLIPPKGGTPLQIEASGRRADLSQVINQLVIQVLQHLKLRVTSAAWNSTEEAEQFYAEAQWALKWNLSPQAQAAAESAWALGKRTTESARLVIRAYVENLPENGINGSDIPVYQVPNASWFAPLDRGVEFFVQNAPVLFAETNSLASFQLGLRLVRPALGQLESYYYAAEQRADEAEALLSLRDKVRRMIKVLDGHLPSLTNQRFTPSKDARKMYSKLKWVEGGIVFERPEEAADFYRTFLEVGVRYPSLPRIVGWTWADRQRAPGLFRDLIATASLSTNVMTQLEGHFLVFLLAPNDEPGSLQRAEEALETAIWAHRGELFRTEEYAALVESLRKVLIKKYGDGSSEVVYGREPFASFKHRLRSDFLASAAGTNLAVLDELFPNTSEKMETPEQARELLPLVEALAPRSSSSNSVNYKLTSLRRNAGLATPPPPTALPQVAASVLDLKFVSWRTAQAGGLTWKERRCSGMIWRQDRLWVRAYQAGSTFSELDLTGPFSFLAIDPQRGVREEVLFPDTLGRPGNLFEVSRKALFAEAGGRLYEYPFDQKKWREIPVPMEGATRLVWLKDRLFIGRNDGLQSVTPGSNKVEVLVSSRRTPAVNAIDPLWSERARIFGLADGKLGVLATEDFLTFDAATTAWMKFPLPLQGTNAFYGMTADYFSPAGAQRLLTGPFARRYLIGFWGDNNIESLLMEETGVPLKPPKAEKLLPPPRWDWPRNYPLEHSQIVADEKHKLWVLAPRRLGTMTGNQEPVKFSDARDATLFCFTPDIREPLSVAVHFPMGEVESRLAINDQPVDAMEPNNFGNMMSFMRLQRIEGNMAFWLRTPNGLVFGGPKFGGHWFISDAVLEEAFAAEQKIRSSASATQPTL